jgi:N-acyl-L-homoserine lactone synthetase
VTQPTLEKAHFRGATAGQATWYGSMRLAETNCPYTIVHEFAHLCGNMHHDIGFRRDVIKLSSRFLGTEFAKMLKGQFKKSKLKVTVSQHIMTPEKWIESVMRMEKIRMEKS